MDLKHLIKVSLIVVEKKQDKHPRLNATDYICAFMFIDIPISYSQGQMKQKIPQMHHYVLQSKNQIVEIQFRFAKITTTFYI